MICATLGCLFLWMGTINALPICDSNYCDIPKENVFFFSEIYTALPYSLLIGLEYSQDMVGRTFSRADIQVFLVLLFELCSCLRNPGGLFRWGIDGQSGRLQGLTMFWLLSMWDGLVYGPLWSAYCRSWLQYLHVFTLYKFYCPGFGRKRCPQFSLNCLQNF